MLQIEAVFRCNYSHRATRFPSNWATSGGGFRLQVEFSDRMPSVWNIFPISIPKDLPTLTEGSPKDEEKINLLRFRDFHSQIHCSASVFYPVSRVSLWSLVIKVIQPSPPSLPLCLPLTCYGPAAFLLPLKGRNKAAGQQQINSSSPATEGGEQRVRPTNPAKRASDRPFWISAH